jgi:hypothetical protein
MANIPGWYSSLPGGDLPIPMTFGRQGGKLDTNDYGGKFDIEGELEPIAVDVVEYVLAVKKGGALGISFSRFTFSFENGIIEVEPRDKRFESDPIVQELIEKIRRVIEMKVFL